MKNNMISDNMLYLKRMEERTRNSQFKEYELIAQERDKIFKKEYMQKCDQIIKEALIKMNDAGWTLPMIVSIRQIKYISKLDDSKIDDFFCEFFGYENNFNNMILDIKNSKIEEKYKVVVEQCVNAYNLELYILVAITLLTVIEGVLSSFYYDKKNTCMKMICKKIISEIDDTEEDIIKKNSWKSYQNFINKLYESSDFDKNEPSFINRHWLLHGRALYDLKKADCLRLFNAISTISYIIDNSDS